MLFEPSNFIRCITLVVWHITAVVCGGSFDMIVDKAGSYCIFTVIQCDFRGRDVPGLALTVTIIFFKRVKIAHLQVMRDTLSLYGRKRTHPSKIGSWLSWRNSLAHCNILPACMQLQNKYGKRRQCNKIQRVNLKEIVHHKMKMLSLFTYPYVIPNLHDLLSFVERKYHTTAFCEKRTEI